MRIGQNPSRIDAFAYSPEEIGLASLVFIPHLEGYFAESLSILRAHLESLLKNTNQSFDLLVFDNGSCREVKELLHQLQQKGWIRWLVSSDVNLGKTGALNWIISSLPNPILGYSDFDVFFREGWLESSLAILKGFDDTGIVTAQPCFYDILGGKSKVTKKILESGQVEDYYPEEWVVDEYCRGINASENLRFHYLKTPLKIVNNSKGLKAVLGASHMQFIAYRDVLQKILPLPATRGLSPEEDRVLNQRIDDLGRLHLSSTYPFVVHMGNRIDNNLELEMGCITEVLKHRFPTTSKKTSRNIPWVLLYRLATNRWLKRYFLRIYNALFEIFSER